MKLILISIAVIVSCIVVTMGQDSTTSTTPIISTTSRTSSTHWPLPDGLVPHPRFFFGSGDPCSNSFYQFLGITDAKCSLQCYIQGGLQNGGYCQDGVCQCNQEVKNAP